MPGSPRTSEDGGVADRGQQEPEQRAGERLQPDRRAQRRAHRQPAYDERLGLGAHRVGEVDDAGDEEREAHVGGEPALEEPDEPRGQRRAGEAQHQPRHPVPQPVRDRLLHGHPRGVRRREVAAEPGEVLVVGPQQQAEQPRRRHQPVEQAVLVHDREARLPVPDGLPGRLLAVVAEGDDGRVGVQQLRRGRPRRRRQHPRERHQAEQPRRRTRLRAHGDVRHRVVGARPQPRQDLLGGVLEAAHRDPQGHVLVDRTGQLGQRRGLRGCGMGGQHGWLLAGGGTSTIPRAAPGS